MKVLTLVGTRPEIIRLARVIPLLDQVTDHVLVHTGQNWDPMLNDVFFDELQIRRPDHVMELNHASLGSQLGSILTGVEAILKNERPDVFLCLGDTNSSIAAVMAKRMKVPVFHMEAGNRCFDENVPEETNRRLVDHVADFNIAYTEHARRNLLAEGLPPRRIAVTGSPMNEVISHYRGAVESSDVLKRLGLSEGQFFLVSAHREENVDAPGRLSAMLECLRRVHDEWTLPVLVSTHPRTRKRLEALPGAGELPGVTFSPPFGFLDYLKLQMSARCVLSDSGTISEEAAILGFPAVTLRNSMERPEALELGSILMTGLDPDVVVENVAWAVERGQLTSLPAGYEVPDTAQRTVSFILSTARLHAEWAGIRGYEGQEL